MTREPEEHSVQDGLSIGGRKEVVLSVVLHLIHSGVQETQVMDLFLQGAPDRQAGAAVECRVEFASVVGHGPGVDF